MKFINLLLRRKAVSYLRGISDPYSVITPIEFGVTFPEKTSLLKKKYSKDIELFRELIFESDSTGELLGKIRTSNIPGPTRMSLLKLFRRCVSLVCDTETTKKIVKVKTQTLIDNYGNTFKPIESLKDDFKELTSELVATLSVLIGEYDDRGKHGYILTDLFFSWIEETFPKFSIGGPRGAGKDIEFSELYPDFKGSCPCDFVIKDEKFSVLAIGFARYDSTRGGAQSDDRTGGNVDKVNKVSKYCGQKGVSLKIIFLSDGPGMNHNDTWEESCKLDDSWDGNVRVTTLALAEKRIEEKWLKS
jgi:hypothetical protein